MRVAIDQPRGDQPAFTINRFHRIELRQFVRGTGIRNPVLHLRNRTLVDQAQARPTLRKRGETRIQVDAIAAHQKTPLEFRSELRFNCLYKRASR